MSQENSSKPKFLQIVAKEKDLLRSKRRQQHIPDQDTDYFGIALSGGGIRSATVNLGVLEVLNSCHVLEQADYLSSVSGGGYIAGYVTSHLRRDGRQAYKHMFLPAEIDSLRKYSFYLTPGQGRGLTLSRLRLVGALVASFLMNCIWIAALSGILIFGLKYVFELCILLLASGTPLYKSHPLCPHRHLFNLDLELLRPRPAPHSLLEFGLSQYLRRNSPGFPGASGRSAADQSGATSGCQCLLHRARL